MTIRTDSILIPPLDAKFLASPVKYKDRGDLRGRPILIVVIRPMTKLEKKHMYVMAPGPVYVIREYRRRKYFTVYKGFSITSAQKAVDNWYGDNFAINKIDDRVWNF